MSVYIYTYTSILWHTSTCACACMRVCVFVCCVCVYDIKRIPLSLYACIGMHVRVHVRFVYVCIVWPKYPICACPYVYMYACFLCVSASVYTCIYMRTCMYECKFVYSLSLWSVAYPQGNGIYGKKIQDQFRWATGWESADAREREEERERERERERKQSLQQRTSRTFSMGYRLRECSRAGERALREREKKRILYQNIDIAYLYKFWPFYYLWKWMKSKEHDQTRVPKPLPAEIKRWSLQEWFSNISVQVEF